MTSEAQPTSLDACEGAADHERQRAARRLLEVPAELQGRGLTAHLLAQLDACEFVPTPSWREGLGILASTPWHAGAVILDRERSHDLHLEVEALADQFYALAIPQRHVAWETLSQRVAEFPMLRERMERMLPVLDVDPGDYQFERPLQDMIDMTLKSQILAPADLAFHRRRCLANFGWSESHRQAAELFRDRYPELASLEELIGILADMPAWGESYDPAEDVSDEPDYVGKTTNRWGPGTTRTVACVYGAIIAIPLLLGLLAVMFGPQRYEPSRPRLPAPYRDNWEQRPIDSERSRAEADRYWRWHRLDVRSARPRSK